MIFNEIKCHVNTSLGLVGGMHPPLCPRRAADQGPWKILCEGHMSYSITQQYEGRT